MQANSGVGVYIEESANMSRYWWHWLPIASALALPLWAYLYPENYRAVWQGEVTGLLELSHAAFPFIASVIAIRLLMIEPIRREPLIAAALLFLCIGGGYLAGEEVSWGQHHFGWATPGYLQEVNEQHETNLHNISPWANHVPRAVLITLIVLGGTAFPIVKIHRPDWCIRRLDFLYPPRRLFTLAMIILALEGLIQLGNNYDLSNWVRFHDGELQETYIVAAVLLYALVLWDRSKHTRQSEP